MATQFHVIHSSSVNGVGIFAGGTVVCALQWTHYNLKYLKLIIEFSLSTIRLRPGISGRVVKLHVIPKPRCNG